MASLSGSGPAEKAGRPEPAFQPVHPAFFPLHQQKIRHSSSAGNVELHTPVFLVYDQP